MKTQNDRSASGEFGYREIFDISKGIAILGVVIFHFFDLMEKRDLIGAEFSLLTLASKVGSQGVLVFFFLSGYGLMHSLLKRQAAREKAVDFFSKRVHRIYPQYLLAILLCGVLYILLPYSSWPVSLLTVLSDVFLLRNFSEVTIHGLNGNWWFVATLFQLYFLYYLSSRMLVQSRPLVIVVAGLAIDLVYKTSIVTASQAGLIAHLDPAELNPFTALGLNYVFPFFFGVALAKWVIQSGEKKPGPALLALGLVVSMAFEFIGYKLSFSALGRVYNDLFFLVGYMIFVFVFSQVLLQLRFLNPLKRLFLFMSLISFEIYLIHHPLIKLTLEADVSDNWLFLLLMSSLLVLILSIATGRMATMLTARFSV